MRATHKSRSSGAAARTYLLALAGLFMTAAVTSGQPAPSATAADADIMRGWRTFHNKGCVDCHAIWDQGGRVGPDLGRIRAGSLTGGTLAGVMWNHIPKMLGQMKQIGHPPTVLSRDEMADLFALMFFVRQLDEPGDARRGEGILRAKGCVQCHEMGSEGKGIGPDLAKWGQFVNPIAWSQMMWEHAPTMQDAMRRSGITWPKLEGADLVHIIAYVRSMGLAGEKTYLRPGSAMRGEKLFVEKNCDHCHPGAGPDLRAADLPSSVGALASRMWNHSPEMSKAMMEQDVARRPIDAQELADIVAFVLALTTVDRGGDAERGGKIFLQKGCAQCHEREEAAKSPAPAIGKLGVNASPVNIAAAMWNHGETMLAKMTEAGLSWPVFHDHEMADLLAYLEAVRSPKP